MSGAGNTFFILVSEEGTKEERANFAKRVCNDYIGFNTDGFLFMQKKTGYDLAWDFYNSDGSSAEMCGNAARCAALYFHQKVKAQDSISFLTAAGEVTAQVLDAEQGAIQVRMPEIKKPGIAKEVEIAGKKVRGFFVNTGVPHFVIQSDPNQQLAQALRKTDAFGPAGANITFTEFDESDFIQAVTFERGVENFTLACGTGAVAAANFHHACFPDILIQSIEMPGGLLQVEWQKQIPILTGPAEMQFDLQFYKENS